MNDSLYQQIMIFQKVLKSNFEKPLVTITDLDNFYCYLDENLDTTVFATCNFFPHEVKRDIAKTWIHTNFDDIVGGQNVSIKFVYWDGWDKKSPYVRADFNIHHHDYEDQVIAVLSTKGLVTTLFSINSKLNTAKKSD